MSSRWINHVSLNLCKFCIVFRTRDLHFHSMFFFKRPQNTETFSTLYEWNDSPWVGSVDITLHKPTNVVLAVTGIYWQNRTEHKESITLYFLLHRNWSCKNMLTPMWKVLQAYKAYFLMFSVLYRCLSIFGVY